jgi:hypothetical protein
MGFRKGQWVKCTVKGKTVVGIHQPDSVHIVDDAGETVQVVPHAFAEWQPVVDVADIPAPRRAHLPDGYNPATRTMPAPEAEPEAAAGK